MKEFETKIIKASNSYRIIIPQIVVQKEKLKVGEEISLYIIRKN